MITEAEAAERATARHARHIATPYYKPPTMGRRNAFATTFTDDVTAQQAERQAEREARRAAIAYNA